VAEDGIPAELRDFIARHIDSVGQLEALLLLRDNAERGWSASELAARLYVAEAEAAAILAHLAVQGFVTVKGETVQYDRQARQAGMVDRLAETYARQLIPITNLIHAKPRGIRAFADAFKLKRDK
jgi:hypothetical protein